MTHRVFGTERPARLGEPQLAAGFGWLLWMVTLAATVAALLLAGLAPPGVPRPDAIWSIVFVTLTLSYSTVGVLIVRRQPRVEGVAEAATRRVLAAHKRAARSGPAEGRALPTRRSGRGGT